MVSRRNGGGNAATLAPSRLSTSVVSASSGHNVAGLETETALNQREGQEAVQPLGVKQTNRIWGSVLQRLQRGVAESSYRVWLQLIQLESLNLPGPAWESRVWGAADQSNGPWKLPTPHHAKAVITVPNAFAAVWVRERFGLLIQQALQELLGQKCRVTFTSAEHRRDGRAFHGASPGGPQQLRQANSPIHALDGLPRQAGDPGSVPDLDWRMAEDAEVAEGDDTWNQSGASKSVADDFNGLLETLNEAFNLDRYLIGRGNQAAVYLAQALADGHQLPKTQDPVAGETSFAPKKGLVLCIHGGEGVGKTHLLQGIGLRAQATRKASVGYLSAVHAAERLDVSTVHELAARLDMLLVDDLSMFLAPGPTQVGMRRLQRLIEVMLTQGKSVAVAFTSTGSVPVAAYNGLRRLCERGPWVEIDGRDERLRAAIISRRALELGFNLSDSTLLALAQAPHTVGQILAEVERINDVGSAVSIEPEDYIPMPSYGQRKQYATSPTLCRPPQERINRTDEGAFASECNDWEANRTTFPQKARLALEEIARFSTPDDVSNVETEGSLEPAGPESASRMQPRSLSCGVPDIVASTVAAYYGVPLLDLRSPGRDAFVLLPRQVAMYLMRKVQGRQIPYHEIAAYFGKRDHTTPLHACEKVQRLLIWGEKSDGILWKQMRELIAILSNFVKITC